MFRKTVSFLGALLIATTTFLLTAAPAQAQMRGSFARGGNHGSFPGPGMSHVGNLNHGGFRSPRVIFFGGYYPYNYWWGNPYYGNPYYGYPYYGNPYYVDGTDLRYYIP